MNAPTLTDYISELHKQVADMERMKQEEQKKEDLLRTMLSSERGREEYLNGITPETWAAERAALREKALHKKDAMVYGGFEHSKRERFREKLMRGKLR